MLAHELLTAEDLQYCIDIRRRIHRRPELGFDLPETSALVTAELQKLGLEVNNSYAPCSAVAWLNPEASGPRIMMRADMDALPVTEKTDLPFSSEIPGRMHACGHDTHTAVLLGAARILQEHRQEFAGRIVLYFERGEEHGHGDYYMMKYIQDQKIHVDGCWAMHCRANIPAGKIGLIPGGINAGSTSWGVSISNENGRAVSCAAAVVRNLNTARMRAVSPFEPTSFTVCRFQFGTDNVRIPGTCQLTGTCRFHHADNAGRPMKQTIRRIIESTCAAYGCEIKRLTQSGPTRGVINDPFCAELGKNAIENALGQGSVIPFEPTMGGESFSVLTAYYPGVMAMMGTGNKEKGMDGPAHNPIFDPDEAGFKYGVSATVAYALAFLANRQEIPFTPFEGDIEAYMESIKN